MKSSIAIVIAALFATATAFAQNHPAQARNAPTQVAQASGGGSSSGAGAATGATGAGMSTGTIVAIGAGVAVVAAAANRSSTPPTHH